jgi:catechol 2,3-dioxygenase-like lactoylglutathione lyase family enzyme
MSVQVSFMSEGGSGTPVPDLSVEVDDVDVAFGKFTSAGFEIAYGPVVEPWGVRRFFVRDPFGRLVNVLSHVDRSERP